MRKHTTLIISSRLDYHARAVAWGLTQRGLDVAYLDTTAFGGCDLDVEFLASSEDARLHVAGLPGFNAVYNRRPYPARCGREVPCDARKFVELEQNTFNRWVPLALSRIGAARWLNPIEGNRAAENKLLQLKFARESGLRIPCTFVGSDPARIRAFVQSQSDGAIYKPLTAHFWVRDGVPLLQTQTSVVKDLAALSDAALGACAGIYQQRIRKVADVRTIVVGDACYSAAFETAPDGDEVDFRRYLLAGRIEARRFELPAQPRDALMRLMRRFDIAYAAADFAVGERGELHFLELNPAGQFAFVEAMVPELPVLDAVVRHLAGNACKAPRVTLADYDGSEDFRLWECEVDGNDNQALRPDFVMSELT